MNDFILFIDSGIGGTNLLKLTQNLLPHESFLYVADTQNLPYGNKSKCRVTKLVTKKIKQVTNKYPVKMIVLACNTATATSVTTLRKTFSIPVVGIEPAIKKALDLGHKNILVIATSATVKHSKIIKKYHNYPYVPAEFLRAKIKTNGTKLRKNSGCYGTCCSFKVGCPAAKITIKKDRKLAKLIESRSAKLLKHLSKYKKYSACDAVVLGCTHYVFATDKLKRIFNKAKFYEASPYVAKRIKQVLILENILKNKGKGKTIFLD